MQLGEASGKLIQGSWGRFRTSELTSSSGRDCNFESNYLHAIAINCDIEACNFN